MFAVTVDAMEPGGPTTTDGRGLRFQNEAARDEILAYITRERLGSGATLPPERTLAKTLGISSETVRGGLLLLERDGLIRRDPGSTTYQTEPRVPLDVRVLVSLTRAILAAGMTPGARVVLARQVPATEDLADRFEAPVGTALHQIERVRYVDNRVIAYERSFFPVAIAPNLMSFDMERSIYEVLEREFGVKLFRAEQQFGASVADEAIAPLLECRVGDPLMVVRRVAFELGGRVVEYAVDRFLPARTLFHSTALVT
jgi:DNA-binding GntR family transcriptional regulator